MIKYLLPVLCISCDYTQKYWCDSFNGDNSCYISSNCEILSDPVSVPSELSVKLQTFLPTLTNYSSCDYKTFSKCNDSDTDDYFECINKSKCQMLVDPKELIKLPEEVWMAVRAKHLLPHDINDNEFEAYITYQKCCESCDEVCEAASEEDDLECIENCILTFCM